MDVPPGASENILTDEDRLCLWIGRVARIHVQMDLMLREVHRTLTSPSPAVYLASSYQSTDRLVHDCRLMLSYAQVPQAVIDTGARALQAATDANCLRNRVVHDMWLYDGTNAEANAASPRWAIFQNSRRGSIGMLPVDPPRDLPYVKGVYTDLTNAYLKASALQSALLDNLPNLRGSLGDATGKIDWVWVMDHQHTLNADGTFSLVVDHLATAIPAPSS